MYFFKACSLLFPLSPIHFTLTQSKNSINSSSYYYCHITVSEDKLVFHTVRCLTEDPENSHEKSSRTHTIHSSEALTKDAYLLPTVITYSFYAPLMYLIGTHITLIYLMPSKCTCLLFVCTLSLSVCRKFQIT